MAEEYSMCLQHTMTEPYCGLSLFLDHCTRLETAYTWVLAFTDQFFIDTNAHAGFMLTALT